MDVLVYVDKITPRLKYIFDHIFINLLGLSIEFTHNSEKFCNYHSCKINYSKKKISNEIFFLASDILFESSVHSLDVTVSTYNSKKVLFACKESDLCFDIFAATFYLLSRYEEYLSYKKDIFGRYPPEESIAYKNNFLHTPIIEYWLLFLQELLLKKFPHLVFKNHTFKFHNTIDIDNAYAFLEKGFFRNAMSLLKDLFSFNFKNIILRLRVLTFNAKDPYDTYGYILSIHKRFKLDTLLFFLLAKHSRYDRGVSMHSNNLKILIRKLSKNFRIGLHSSFNSVDNPHFLSLEHKKINHILESKIQDNRQHYIKLKLPFVYRNLIKNNISKDFSMGYPSKVGFRAGTSRSFIFFDLISNKITNLRVYPFSVMDTTLNDYLSLDPKQASSFIEGHIDILKEVNGTYRSIWHNESFSFINRWKNWDNVYINMIKYISYGSS